LVNIIETTGPLTLPELHPERARRLDSARAEDRRRVPVHWQPAIERRPRGAAGLAQ